MCVCVYMSICVCYCCCRCLYAVQYYGPGICQEVRKRHVESFIHFQSVPGLAGYLSKNNIKLSAVGQSKQPQQQHTASRSVSTEPRSAASTPAMQHQHAQ
eukprot:scpid103246/ scgid2156/ 